MGCGRAVEAAVVLCERCQQTLPRLLVPPPTPPQLLACFAAVEFRGPVESWIHRFKYPRAGLAGLDPAALAVARLLIREAAQGALAAGAARPARVVAVPLHPRRLRRRGFNPAALLARSVARELGAPCAPVALERLRDTPSQTGLDRAARRRNLRGAFRARIPLAGDDPVWLVDDVLTTGSTLAEAARALRRAGAKRVVGLCAARTPEPGGL